MGATLADGLMITMTGEHNYPLIDKYVDEIVPASDEFIYKALMEIVFKSKLLVEPSASVGVAAALEGSFKVKPGEKISDTTKRHASNRMMRVVLYYPYIRTAYSSEK